MIYYHATFRAYLDSILTRGLGGVQHKNWEFSTGDVCLAPEPCEAESYAETAEDTPAEIWDSGIVVLEVDTSGLTLQPDPNLDAGRTDCRVFSGIISPRRLRVHETAGR